jgi:pyridoxine 5-phosphate synthase
MAARLSVNINKVATLRKSRGGDTPSLDEAVSVILAAGATGLTVHPRSDERHVRLSDLRDLATRIEPQRDRIELNVEGDPRPDLMDLVVELRPHQCTLVPVRPGEITSEAGWDPRGPKQDLSRVIERLHAASVRVSIFVDPANEPIEWAHDLGADRVELYTEPFARAFASGTGDDAFRTYAIASELAHRLGLGVNAGHDLDLENLALFRKLPYLDEVSIGHALISRALFVGLDRVVREYIERLRGD